MLLKFLDPLSPSRIGTDGLPISSPHTARGNPPGRENPRTDKNRETDRSQIFTYSIQDQRLTLSRTVRRMVNMVIQRGGLAIQTVTDRQMQHDHRRRQLVLHMQRTGAPHRFHRRLIQRLMP